MQFRGLEPLRCFDVLHMDYHIKRGQTQAAGELVTLEEPRVGAALLRRQAKARAGETVSPVTPITLRKLFKSACEFLTLDILN